MKVTDTDGNEVRSGDIITSFRGEKGTLVKPLAVREPGKSGKVLVQWKDRPGERPWTYYDKVFGLTVTED